LTYGRKERYFQFDVNDG